MVKNEWKNLYHNKLLLVVLIAIIGIPVIYAGFFLNSMWDPYGNIDQLPVAVVNDDEPVDYEGKTLEVGNEMVDELKKNEGMQFNFVDAQTARDGLRNGTYYMVITIPKEFSGNATTLMDKEPKKMELNYETNPGTNYIASKMSETALAKIKDNVQKEVIRTYTEAVFDQIGVAGDGMQEAADGAGELKDGIMEASKGNETISSNLDMLAQSTVTFTNGAGDLQAGIRKYTDGVAVLNQKAPTLITGISSLNNGASDLADGAKTLSTGADSYVKGAGALADGTMAYVKGAKQLSDGAKQLEPLEKGLGSAYQGIQTIHAAVSKDNYDGKGSPSLTTGTAALQQGLDEIYRQVDQLENSSSAAMLEKFANGVQTAGRGMENGAKGMEAASQTIGAVTQGIAREQTILNQAVSDLETSVDNVNQALAGKVKNANQQIQDASQTIGSANSQIKKINEQIADRNNKIKSADNSIDEAVKTIEEAEAEAKAKGVSLDLSTQKNALKGAKISSVDTVNEIQIPSNISDINGIDKIQMDGAVKKNIAAINEDLSKAATGLDDGAKELSNGAKALNKGASSIPQIPNHPLGVLKAALKEADEGASAVHQGVKSISAGLGTLERSTEAFPQAGKGIEALNEGFDTLTANNDTLTSGAKELKKQGNNLTTGAAQVSQGASQLATGTQTLSQGAGLLSDGVTALASNNNTLNSGAGQLADGSAKIQSGAKRLADGSRTLGEGMEQLGDGSLELCEALTDGAKEVKDSKAEQQNIEMFSAPIKEKETQMTTVENNGHAMAPYMMSVGLWVGCLAFCLIYPLMSYKGKLKSGFAWWGSKASVLYPVAALQGMLLIVLLHFTIGFTPAEMGKTIAFSCLTAVTFTSIMYFFNITLGKVGSFLMLVFMVIQLAGSAGTYPVEISPAFVSRIHWYLPFTYTVNSFRSTIAGGESIRNAVIIMIVLFIVFTVLTILAFQVKTKRKQEGKMILFDWLEERGLA